MRDKHLFGEQELVIFVVAYTPNTRTQRGQLHIVTLNFRKELHGRLFQGQLAKNLFPGFFGVGWSEHGSSQSEFDYNPSFSSWPTWQLSGSCWLSFSPSYRVLNLDFSSTFSGTAEGSRGVKSCHRMDAQGTRTKKSLPSPVELPEKQQTGR